MEIALLGVLTAIALIILMCKVNLKFFIYYQVYTDVAVSLGLMLVFLGTFTGMIVSVTAGIIVSIFLYVSGLIIKVNEAEMEKYKL